MARRPSYTPPPLTLRIRVRNQKDRPMDAEERYGLPIVDSPGWGVVIWAHRRDRAPTDPTVEDGVLSHERITIWTIRHRKDIEVPADVVYGGRVYPLLGPPVERGGPGFGRQARYLELHTELRT